MTITAEMRSPDREGAWVYDLLRCPAPTDLSSWCWQALQASFKSDEFADVSSGFLSYVRWLDSLPVVQDER